MSKINNRVRVLQNKQKLLGETFLRGCKLVLPVAGTAWALTIAAPVSAGAFQLYNGQAAGNNLEISLDTTVSYSAFDRVGVPSKIITQDYNANDGDLNFQHGIVGSVFEALPVLDIKDGDMGAHFSGEYFINTSYFHSNQNTSPATVNPFNINSDGFAPETKQSNGNNGRMLDAFAYDSFHFGDGGDQTITLKAGQQTLFWGQSLFYGTNGIAGGQAPIDVVSAQDEVNPQSQQIFLPVGQGVVTYQPNQTYTFQGYYQYQWEPDSLQGVGSYFSSSDVVGPAAQRIIAEAGATQASTFYLYNQKALTPPSQNGQFGLSAQAQYGNYDVGLFGLRYDSKTPTVYTYIGANTHGQANGIGTYKLVYPRDIQLYGASVSTTIGATNVAGELSTRRNMDLVGSPSPVFSPDTSIGGANAGALYPVGNTLTGLASFIYGSPELRLVPGGVTILGEIEYVKVLSVTANKAELAPSRSTAASAFDLEATPAYFDVLPKLELQFPVSISYNFAGNSEMDSTMNHGTGQVTAGVTATYSATWIASLTYVAYYGSPASAADLPSSALNVDRSYVTLNLQHTF